MPGNGSMTVVVAGTTTTLTTTQPSMQRTEMAIRGSGKRWSSTKFFETFSSKIPFESIERIESLNSRIEERILFSVLRNFRYELSQILWFSRFMAGRRRYLVNFCTMVQVRNYFFDCELDWFYQGIRLARKIISPVSLVVFYVIPQPLHPVFAFRCWSR